MGSTTAFCLFIFKFHLKIATQFGVNVVSIPHVMEARWGLMASVLPPGWGWGGLGVVWGRGLVPHWWFLAGGGE